MSNELVTISDMERMANAVAKSGLFGAKTLEQALALMLIAQAEGRHPASAARDYDIIQGRPSKKAEAMLRDFLAAGGNVEWQTLTDEKVSATFSHPQGGSVMIEWDMNRAKTAGLSTRENWKKYPRAMLRSRVVSEGVRTVYPAATGGLYAPEEAEDVVRHTKPIIAESIPINTAPTAVPVEPETGEVSPHTIIIPNLLEGGTPDWMAWAGKLVAAFKSSGTSEELTDWAFYNKSTLEAAKTNAPLIHERIMKRFTEANQRLVSIEDLGVDPTN